MEIAETAKAKIAELIDAPSEIMPKYRFFLRVTAIEDNGIKYQTYFDYETRADDNLFRFKDFDLRIDNDSLKHLDGAILDYDEETGFVLDNTNK